jgi:two-component system sensor histidine kinase EvgS
MAMLRFRTLAVVAGTAWLSASASAQQQDVLGSEERAWLQQHGVIRVSGDPGWPPFTRLDASGRLSGLDVDLMNELAARSGLSIQWVAAATWQECLRLARAGAVDVLVGTARTPEREDFLAFTRSYLEVPMALIVRTESPFLSVPTAMNGKVAALPSGYVTTQYFERRYPNVAKSYTTNTEQAFLFVARGDADYTVENILAANHMILNRGFSNLKIGGVVDSVFGLRYGVRRELEPLVGILDKALAALPEGRKQELLAQWVGIEGQEHINWRRVRNLAAALVLLAGLMAAFFAYRNHLLDRELKERRRIQAELERARRTLEDLNEEKSRFMAMAAHDLKNPLTSLLMTFDMLDKLPDAERREEILQAVQTTHYMCALVKNLLNAHAIDQGALTVARTHVKLAPVLRRSLERCQTLARSKGIELHADLPDNPPVIQGDEDALEQVMDNLLSNAIKFSPGGSRVAVSVRTLEEGFTRVEVRDQGPGVPPEERPRLFQRFSRLSAIPTAGESSTGLGLSIVKRLVEAMGGNVGVEPGPVSGSIFYFDLPAPAEGK